MQKLRIILYVILAALILAGVANAGAPAQIDRHVIAGGGATVEDGEHFILDGTIGEPIAGDLVGADPLAASGFWEDISPDGEANIPALYRD
jgi:hypothetical protein